MAGELLQAVTSGGAFDLKTLTDTFAAVADRNLKARELDLREKEAAQNSVLKAAGMDLREQALSLRTTQAATAAQGQELLTQQRVLKLQEAQRALTEAKSYTDDIAGATKDGKSLAMRLKSTDPLESEEAYKTFSGIRDKYRGSASKVVTDDLKQMESLPVVQQKTELAQKAEERRQQDVDRKDRQGDRRLDQHDNIIDETERHHKAQEGQGAERIEIGQRNATSRERSVDIREKGKSTDVGLTLPNIGHVSMEKIRSVLARGMAAGATQQEVSDVDVLRKAILAVPSGNKNPDTGANIPRFTNDDIVRWTAEGQDAAKAAPKTPAVRPAIPVKPGAEPSAAPPQPPLPTGGNTSAAPTAAPAGGVDPGDQFLSIYQGVLAAEKLEAAGDTAGALAAYKSLKATTRQFKKDFPEWSPTIVDYRMGRIDEKLGTVGAAPSSASPTPAPSATPAPRAPSESIIPGLPPTTPEPETPPSSPGAPAATPTPASQLLKKYKIPARATPAPAAGGSASADPGTPDSLYASTQNLLSGLGLVPAPQQVVGFGGFGFGLPPV